MEKIISISGHHLAMLGEYIDGRELTPRLFPEYWKEFLRKVRELYENIIQEKHQKIKLCEGLDNICNECPIKTKECEITESKEDNENIKGFKLDKREYSSKEILESIKKFQEKTGWGSPRAKKFFWPY